MSSICWRPLFDTTTTSSEPVSRCLPSGCELSPVRVSPAIHKKVAEWVESSCTRKNGPAARTCGRYYLVEMLPIRGRFTSMPLVLGSSAFAITKPKTAITAIVVANLKNLSIAASVTSRLHPILGRFPRASSMLRWIYKNAEPYAGLGLQIAFSSVAWCPFLCAALHAKRIEKRRGKSLTILRSRRAQR